MEIENSLITANLSVGIKLDGQGTPASIVNNRLVNNAGSGILACSCASGVVENNKIYGNRNGIELRSGGAPVIKNNEIFGAPWEAATATHDLEPLGSANANLIGYGLYSHRGAAGEFSGNRVYDTKMAGILVSGLDSTTSCTSNLVHHCKGGGFVVQGEWSMSCECPEKDSFSSNTLAIILSTAIR
jgi:parallel beta-helix repeat protein